MTHMVCGYPDLEQSQIIFDILKQKSEYIEIQFPFSDPIADWPVIEKANQIALENWVNTEICFDFCERNINNILRPVSESENLELETGLKIKVRILIMTYYNIVLNYWVENFVKKAKEIWVFGFIIPDVPFDEEDWKILRELCKKYDIVFTEIVSPITTKKRLKEIKKLDPQLIYAISQNMTTGSKAKFWDEFEKYINNLKSIFPSLDGREYPKGERGIKIWVWFWVKTREDVVKVCKVADFAIIWSEFIKKINSWEIDELKKYLEEITNL